MLNVVKVKVKTLKIDFPQLEYSYIVCSMYKGVLEKTHDKEKLMISLTGVFLEHLVEHF